MLVRSLDELTAADLPEAGGKGANLGELRRAGFPVPDGFVITTAAYALGAEAAGVTGENPATARVRLAASPVPAGIADAVREAYRALGSPTVAVRSSATAEDLPDASFAGQQDTILGVAGDDAVLDAVRKCWASLWNDRAVAYRRTHDVPARGLRLAVVVQRMVDAESAGVLFTADPITGRRRRAAIEAVRGLGEQLVSGAVNPDHFVVETRSGEVLERRGDILNDGQLRDLAAVGARIEAHFGRPQDIEWAIDGAGKLWIVQSRDITTLYPIPATAPQNEDDLRVYFSANVAQGVFDPFTPMGLQTFRLLSSGIAAAIGRPVRDPAVGASLYAESAMRVFIDMTPVLRNPFGRELPGRVMSAMEFRSQAIFVKLLGDPRLRPRGSKSGSRFRVIGAALHTGSHQRSVGDQQRHGLALHVGAHQRAVGVVVLEERDERRGHRHDLGRVHVHVVDLRRVDLHGHAVTRAAQHRSHELAVLVHLGVGLGDGVVLLLDRIQVLDLFLDLAADDLAVRRLHEAVLRHLGVGAQ